MGLKNLILLPVLSKTFGASEYGMWSQILITISLLMPLITLGLQSTMGRFVTSKKNDEQIKEDFYTILFTVSFWSTVIYIFTYLGSRFFVYVFNDYFYISIIRITTFILILNALDETLLSFFTSVKNIKVYSFFVIFQNIFEIGLISIAAFLDYGLLGAVSALLLSKMISFFVMLGCIKNKIGFKFPSFSNLKILLKYGLPMIPTTMFAWIIHSSDQYMIGYFMSSLNVGIYAAAYSICYIIKMFADPIGIILYPTISELWDESKYSEVGSYIEYSLKYYLMFVIPSTFGMTVIGKQLLLIFSTPEFVDGAIIIPFVASGLVIYGFYSFLSRILTSVMRTDLIAISLGFSAILNIILNILLIPRYGITGSALATFITYATSGIVVSVLAYRYYKYKINWTFIIKSIVASCFMSLSIVSINPHGIVEVLVVILVGAITYFISLLLFNAFNDEEIKVFKNTFITNLLKKYSNRRD